MSQYFVYILSSQSRTLYVGVTSNLPRRIVEHREKRMRGFTARYDVTRLVYYEWTASVHAAIAREKQIKGFRRGKKIHLIESANATWRDLADEVLEEDSSGASPHSE